MLNLHEEDPLGMTTRKREVGENQRGFLYFVFTLLTTRPNVMDTPQPRTVDEYIAGFPEEIQQLLQQIRQTVREAAETIKCLSENFRRMVILKDTTQTKYHLHEAFGS